jgi:glycosyltransferase involved in cell wall biosynthesis
MARALAQRADRIFVSIESWRDRLGREGSRATWLPIPSNLPVVADPSEQASARRELGPGPWVSHFGTYAPAIVRDLVPAIRGIAAANAEVRFLLLGRGAERVAPLLPRDRVVAPGELSAGSVAALLSVSDLALQPFPDGISARRTSAMAALALGVPVVTTLGPLTDSVWRDGGVALAPAGDPSGLARTALELLGDTQRRRELGERATALYQRFFSLERTCDVLQVR